MARRNEFDEKRDIGYADGEKASGLEDGAWQGRRTPGRVAIEHVKRTDYQQTRRRAKRKQLLVDLLVLLFLLSLISGMVAGVWFLIGRYTVHYTTVDVTYTVLFDEVPDVLLYSPSGDQVVGSGTRMYLHGIANDRDELGEITKTEVISSDPDKKTTDLLVIVKTTATYNLDKGYRVADTRIAVGQELDCRFNRLIQTGTVVELMPVQTKGES